MDPIELRRRLEQFSLLDTPGHLLRRNHQRSYEIFMRHVGDDITRQQMALLIALAKQPGAAQKDLVEATGIDKSTLKEMIGRMAAKGWVERGRSISDGRAWAMQITPLGEGIIIEQIDAVEAAQREILAPLPEKHRTILLESLRILIELDDQARAGE